MNSIKANSINKAINDLRIVSAILQIVCSCIMIFFGTLLLFLMAVYGFSDSDISYYTPWIFITTICGISFATVLIILAIKLIRNTNAGKAISIYIVTIILNGAFILLWITTTAIERNYSSFWPYFMSCLPLIPLIVIILLISVLLFLKRRARICNNSPD